MCLYSNLVGKTEGTPRHFVVRLDKSERRGGLAEGSTIAVLGLQSCVASASEQLREFLAAPSSPVAEVAEAA